MVGTICYRVHFSCGALCHVAFHLLDACRQDTCSISPYQRATIASESLACPHCLKMLSNRQRKVKASKNSTQGHTVPEVLCAPAGKNSFRRLSKACARLASGTPLTVLPRPCTPLSQACAPLNHTSMRLQQALQGSSRAQPCAPLQRLSGLQKQRRKLRLSQA